MHVVMPITSHRMLASLPGVCGYWQHGLASCMDECRLALLQAYPQCVHNADFYTMLGTALKQICCPYPETESLTAAHTFQMLLQRIRRSAAQDS